MRRKATLSQSIFGGNSGAAYLGSGRRTHTGPVRMPEPSRRRRPRRFQWTSSPASIASRALERARAPLLPALERGRARARGAAFYAGEYRHAVIALAEAMDAAAPGAEPETARAAGRARRARRPTTWSCGTTSPRRWAPTSSASRAPRPQACRESWTAGRDALENLVAAFTVESGQPAIARTKLDGLVAHYSFEEGPATEYFSLHAERDHEHAAQSRELIEERLADADLDRLLEVAEGVLRGQLGAARRRGALRRVGCGSATFSPAPGSFGIDWGRSPPRQAFPPNS